jgi:hypothetical protein
VSASESRDGQGFGDHDVEYRWGSPRACLTTWQQAHLLVMRGYVRDRSGPIIGDSDYVVSTASGLFVPSEGWRD